MRNNRDFASYLDDEFEPLKPDDFAPGPSIPFDYLSVTDELHSGRITVSPDLATEEYRATGSELEAELADLLTRTEIVPEALPSIEPDEIALELGISDTSSPDELGSARRRFAFANHPDRVPAHLRDRAIVRMQVANMLIDAARRKGE